MMRNDFRHIRPLLILLTLSLACANSVTLVRPTPPGANQPPTPVPQPVDFEVSFHQRADRSTFKAFVLPKDQVSSPGNPCSIPCDITNQFTGGTTARWPTTNSNPSVLPAGEYILRLAAGMSPSQAFDGLGEDNFFAVLALPTPPGPPPPSTPSYSLTLQTPSQPVHYDDIAEATVQLVRNGNFHESVNLTLSAPAAPVSSNWDFFDGQTSSRSIDGGSANLTRTLRGPVTPALFMPGSNAITVSGISTNTGQRATTQSNLTVSRTLGEFTHIYPQPKNPGGVDVFCDDPPARVEVNYRNAGTNVFQVTFARVDLPARPITSPTSAVYYLISPHCRMGLALAGVGLNQTVQLFNLGFTGRNWSINAPRRLSGAALRQQYWMSRDDSTLVVIRIIEQTPDSQLPPGAQPGTIFTYGASLVDAVSGASLGSEQIFHSINLLADIKEMDAHARGMQFNVNQDQDFSDPDPDPNQVAPAIADIYKVELMRDPRSETLFVDGTYRVLNGPLDGQSFEQELAARPDRFGKFHLTIP
jgi:hypothetical protein